MGLIKDFMQRARERKEKLANYQDDDRINTTVHERKKSHWERELNKDLEEEKQKYIKEAVFLEGKRRQLQDKINARNMMKFNPSHFQNDEILRQKNIFLRGGQF